MKFIPFSRLFEVLQKVGQSLMVPVSVLPAAGILVALGRMIDGPAGQIMYSGGLAVFEQLPLIFAIGVAIGFTGGAGIAGLAAVVGYTTLINVLKVMSDAQKLELAINTGVFGGILIGLITAALYKRFHEIKLPLVFGFFSGKRFVPIVTAFAAIATGFVLGFGWPPIQKAIYVFGQDILNSSLGPAFYAAGKRLLIPVGLHHVFYPPFLYQFGEFVTSAGQTVHGEAARYFAGDPTAGRFMASEFPIMLFGLPAATLAMWLAAPKKRRKVVAGVMLSAALTSIVTGITEPIEFAFIFVAPLLYVVHVGLAFASGYLTGLFDVHLGYTFSASIIDMVLGWFNQKNSMILLGLIGPVIALAYFGTFYTLIRYFDFATPGREKDEKADDNLANVGMTATDRVHKIVAALGATGNIQALDACITRLRLTVKDASQVNQSALKALGAAGIMRAGNNFQVIFGVESDHIKEQIKQLMKTMEHSVGIHSPVRGKIVSLNDVPDATFSERILGDGFAVVPDDGVVYSPLNGTVSSIFPTGHALGLISDEGLELLIHVGIDTVKMKGEGFKSFVKDGDVVKKGQKLVEFDLDLVSQKAKSTVTPVIVTNSGSYKNLRLNPGGSSSEPALFLDI